MINVVSVRAGLAWECDCEQGIDEPVTHQLSNNNIVELWCDLLDHVKETHQRVGVDLYLGLVVVGLTAQHFQVAQKMRLVLKPPFEFESDGLLTGPS